MHILTGLFAGLEKNGKRILMEAVFTKKHDFDLYCPAAVVYSIYKRCKEHDN